MAKSSTLLAALAFTALALSAPAAASQIVDTGPGPAAGGLEWVLGTEQSLGAEFTTSQEYTLTSVEGWIDPYSIDTYMASIYTNVGGLPGTQLFSGGESPATILDAQWLGATGVSWNLPAGTYWAVFSASGSLVSGGMPNPSVAPLSNEAFNLLGNGWLNYQLGLGVRISGDLTQGGVPEPATWAMMLLGFGAVGWSVRRKQRPAGLPQVA